MGKQMLIASMLGLFTPYGNKSKPVQLRSKTRTLADQEAIEKAEARRKRKAQRNLDNL